MLTVFVATFVIFALVILGMSLGYLIKRKTIGGSCGGSHRWVWKRFATALSPAMRVKTHGTRSAAQSGSHHLTSRPHRAAFFDLPRLRFCR